MVSGYADTKMALQRLVEGPLPSLSIAQVIKLTTKGEDGHVVLEVVSSQGFHIDYMLDLSKHPKSIKLLKCIEIENFPWAITQWNDYTLVALDTGEIASIDSSYQVNPSFLTVKGIPAAMQVYNDRLFILTCHSRDELLKISVHDPQGKLVTSWYHKRTRSQRCGMAIVSEQVIVLDATDRCLCIYSLSGERVKSISCPQCQDGNTSLSALGVDTVVVYDWLSSQVCRINISTGELLWTCKDIILSPRAIACNGQRYILVASYCSVKLAVLDSNTGDIACELSDEAKVSCDCPPDPPDVFDLCFAGDTLVVADYTVDSIFAASIVFNQLLF